LTSLTLAVGPLVMVVRDECRRRGNFGMQRGGQIMDTDRTLILAEQIKIQSVSFRRDELDAPGR
jgi:hypothetical protein